MSDSQSTGFGKFIPGFDFLQNLTKGASESSPQMPNLGSWIAPSLNVEELDKRISELKTVHFWLEQNSKALGATVQALEVQKMTLATLKGMNFSIGDIASSLFAGMPKAPEKTAPASKTISEMAAEAEAATAAQKARDAARDAVPPTEEAAAKPAAPAMVDPMQLWGSLTEQFQKIAATALKEVNANAAIEATKTMANEFVKEAVSATKKATASVVNPTAPVAPVAKAAAKAPAKPAAKPAAKKVAAKVAKKSTDRSI